VDIKAYDLGEPQLSSVTAVPILVRHSATVAPEIGLGWADDLYTVEVPEDTPPGTLLKSLTIINSAAHRNSPAPLRCLIVGGNEDGERPRSFLRVGKLITRVCGCAGFKQPYRVNFRVCIHSTSFQLLSLNRQER